MSRVSRIFLQYFDKTVILDKKRTVSASYYSEDFTVSQAKESRPNTHKYRYNDGINTVTSIGCGFVDKKRIDMVRWIVEKACMMRISFV